MSYLRPAQPRAPDRLEAQAGLAWCRAVLALLRRHRHSFSDSVCLRVLRGRLCGHLARTLPHCLRQELFQQGCLALRREAPWSAIRDYLSPDMFVPYLSSCYTTDTARLEVPGLARPQDRLSVLDTLHQLGPHQADHLTLQLFDCPAISAEESSLTARALAGFPHLSSLTLWRACDDRMLGLLGAACPLLASLDIWRSAEATDRGVRALLGLDLARPGPACAALRSVAIRDTSVSDSGAFQLLIHCHGLTHLQFSQDAFLQQLQWRVRSNLATTGTTFRLQAAFLQVSKASELQELTRSLPELQELTVWTAMEAATGLLPGTLPRLSSLKLGGLNHPACLAGMVAAAGPRLTCLKVETVHFDLDIHTIGRCCPLLQELHVVNARLKVGDGTEQPHSAGTLA